MFRVTTDVNKAQTADRFGMSQFLPVFGGRWDEHRFQIFRVTTVTVLRPNQIADPRSVNLVYFCQSSLFPLKLQPTFLIALAGLER